MRRYAKFRPTGYDQHIAVQDREDWLVLPCQQNRDSSLVDQSNFAVALERLGGESEEVEVHRFGHWSVGWYEIILAHPSRETSVTEIESALEEHSILDEDDLSERESDSEGSAWVAYGARDIRKLLVSEFDLHDPTANWFTDDRLWDLYSDKASGTEYTNEGPKFVTGWIIASRFTRGGLARWIRRRRAEERSKP